jgi:hypothetical protein
MVTLSDKQLHTLARLGAAVRLQALEEEAAAIRRMFPGLQKAAEHGSTPAAAAAKPARPKGRMTSESARRQHSEKMKLYWVRKRAEAAAATEAATEAAPAPGATEASDASDAAVRPAPAARQAPSKRARAKARRRASRPSKNPKA